MKRASTGNENYEHVLMCLICRSLFDDHEHQPKFLPCHHTFCKECLRQYVQQMGDDIECPSCRRVATIPAAGVSALQTNFYAKYIQSLVYGCSGINPGWVGDCGRHPGHKLLHHCRDCAVSICDVCLKERGCADHKRDLLTAVMEKYCCEIDSAFSKTNSLIESKKFELEGLLKSLADAKDKALIKIESTFEQHIHALTRRATLLKNKVIDIYNEHASNVESDLEEISTGMTCIVSLKEHHELLIGRGDFSDTEKGVEELREVHSNLLERIRPKVNHVRFEEEHGSDPFYKCVKVLGRVVSEPSTVQSCGVSLQNANEPQIQSPGVDTELPESPESPDSIVTNSDDPDNSGKVCAILLVPNSDSVPELGSDCSPSNFKSEMLLNIKANPVESASVETERELNNNPTSVTTVKVDQRDLRGVTSGKDHRGNASNMIVAGLKGTECSVIVNFSSEATTCGRISSESGIVRESPTSSCGEIKGPMLSQTPVLSKENVKEVLIQSQRQMLCAPAASAQSQALASKSSVESNRKIADIVLSNAERFAAHKSYDESSLRTELGYDASDAEDGGATPTRQMSRSDFWLMMSSSVESNLSEHDLIVAELSGEQTSL